MTSGTGKAEAAIATLSKLNFRDLGGIPAPGGLVLRRRRIYRSEGPASFLPAHHAALFALKIGLICDLRAEAERMAAPHDWNTDAELLNLEVAQDLRVATNDGWTALRDHPSEAGAQQAMRMNYAAMPAALQPQLAKLVQAINSNETAVLIHCTAGKDRTGVLVGLLLAYLGVALPEIEADYMRSEIFGRNFRLAGAAENSFSKGFGFAPSGAALNPLIGVDLDYLGAALAAVTRQWGSAGAYFADAGVTAEQAERLRARLLVQAAGQSRQ